MKFTLSLITVLGALSAQALEVACLAQLSSLQSSVQACRFGNNLAACDAVCSTLTPSVGAGCSATEIQLARNDERNRILEAVRLDANVEGVVRVTAFGANEDACLINVRNRAQTVIMDSINRCNSQLRSGLFTCNSALERMIEGPTRVAPFIGNGHIEEKEGDLDDNANTGNNPVVEGANRAAAEAARDAVRDCQATTGAICHISSATPAICQQEEHRSWGIIGRKEKYQDCKASAQALPDASAAFRCTIEMVSRARL
jgi:hypothetical protein